MGESVALSLLAIARTLKRLVDEDMPLPQPAPPDPPSGTRDHRD